MIFVSITTKTSCYLASKPPMAFEISMSSFSLADRRYGCFGRLRLPSMVGKAEEK